MNSCWIKKIKLRVIYLKGKSGVFGDMIKQEDHGEQSTEVKENQEVMVYQ